MSDKDYIVVQHPDVEPDKHRSYHRDVVRYVRPDYPQVQIFGKTKYPMYYASFGEGPKHILVTGGVHGDEPAGTYAALDLMSHFTNDRLYSKDFTIHIYPCINPWGYEHNTRRNGEGLDLNRGFEKQIKGEECRMFADHLIKLGIKEYEFTIDFHEGSRNMIWTEFTIDDNPDGGWVYELCYDHDKRKGRQMVEAVRKAGLPINTLKIVYEDSCHDGLTSYPEDMKSKDYAAMTSFDGFLWNNYTQDAFTTETNSDWSIEDRVKAHHLFFFTALDTLRI